MGIFRHHPRHRYRTLRQRTEASRVDSGGRHDCGTPADKHPQAEILRLGPLQVIGHAQPALHGQRGACHQDGVGRVGAGRTGAADQIGEQAQFGHAARRSVMAARPGTFSAGPMQASVGVARNCRTAARQISSTVTAFSLATVSATGTRRPNT